MGSLISLIIPNFSLLSIYLGSLISLYVSVSFPLLSVYYNHVPNNYTYTHKGGIVMKDNTPMNKFRVSDEVIIAAIEMLGKVLLAFIAAKATHEE